MSNSSRLRTVGRTLIAFGFAFSSIFSVAVAASADFNLGGELYNSGKYSQSLPLLESAVRASAYDDSSH